MTVNNLQVNEEFVRYVLDTYDLPDKTKERLARHSLFRLRENETTDFDEAYTYVDGLAMGAKLRHHARMRSLDEEVGETKRTLHEIIGQEDDSVRKLLESVQSRKKLSEQEIVEYLSYCLDRQDIEILNKLIGRQDVQFDVSLEYLLDNTEQIGERIRQVAQRYEKDGVILLPRRPIVQITWDPLSVEFKKRTRGDHLTDEEKFAIRRAYWEFDGNASAIGRHLGYSGSTVARCCREAGLAGFEKRRKLTFKQEAQIVEAYTKFRGNALAAAKTLGHTGTTVLKQWRYYGFEILPTGKREWPFTEEDIISAYHESEGKTSVAVQIVGCSRTTILKYWRKAGLKE